MGDLDAERARELLEAANRMEVDNVSKHLSDEIIWHVGGEHPLSGDYKGAGAVRDYHARVAELTAGSLHLEPIDILTGERHVGIFLRATASINGHSLDTTMVEAVRLAEDGRWAEFWALADDQPGVDKFWKALAP